MEYFKNDTMARDSIGKDIKWEPHVSKFVELYNDSFPIHNIIDVGASDGVAAKYFNNNLDVGTIFCFEPNPYYYKLLKKMNIQEKI